MKLFHYYVFIPVNIFVIVMFFLGPCANNVQAADSDPKRVFILNSFNRGYTWTDNMMRGIDAAFHDTDVKLETVVRFMDTKRIPPTEQYYRYLKEMIWEGYKNIHFDAILACDNDAFVFIKKYRDELFPGVPVVFASINDFDEKLLNGRRDITGTSENTDYTATIRIALKLRPATKNIVVVIDNTTTGRAHRSAVEKIRHNFPQDIRFTYLSLADMTLAELAEKLSKLENDSIVLLLQHFIDKTGTSYSVQESTPLLTESSAVPVFTVSDTRMGMGPLGGHVVSGYHQGEAAAQMVVEILKGVDVRSIPVLLNSPNKYMFDYRVMRRFKIAESRLPGESIIINKPVSLLDEYRPHLFVILVIFIILCGILVYLLFEIRRRRKADKLIKRSLAEKETLLRELYHRTKNNMAVIIALLELQMGYFDDKRLQQAFAEAQNRIRSMTLVHQKLYEASDLSHINLKDYINDLMQLLMKSYNVSSQRVSFDSNMDDVHVLIDTAVPCGLILNELFSNALKHAFPEDKSGKITIKLHRTEEGEINLEVADNGVGMQPGFDIRQDGNMGLKTIFLLGENQLRAEVNFNTTDGVACSLKFKDNLYQPRV